MTCKILRPLAHAPRAVWPKALSIEQRKAAGLGKHSVVKQLKAKTNSVKQQSVDTLLVVEAFAKFLDILPDQWRWPEDIPMPFSMSKEVLLHFDLLGIDIFYVLADREGSQTLLWG